jgi:hypothetical protein
MTTDPQYREKHLAAHQRWCKQYPLDRYQHQYRQNHPKYVEKNREQQKIRNQQRRKQADPTRIDLIVKNGFTEDADTSSVVSLWRRKRRAKS